MEAALQQVHMGTALLCLSWGVCCCLCCCLLCLKWLASTKGSRSRMLANLAHHSHFVCLHLLQVGRLLVDLRGDSPLCHGTRAPEPAGPPEPENVRPEATLRLDSEGA